MSEAAERYFVITSGRSGSTLLSVLLADSGADFGLPSLADWDPQAGQMEHPVLKRAAHHYRKLHELEAGRDFFLSPRLEARYRHQAGRRHLRRVLPRARYLKAADLDLLVQPAFSLGYIPRLLLIYRRFEDNAASMLPGRKHLGPDAAARDYVRVYRQSLMLLHCFGGCVIAYRDILDPQRREWLQAVCAVTGLDRERLAEAVAARATPVPEAEAAPVLYPEAHRLYEEMEAARGQVIGPARQVLRALDRG